jgi:hypothetical protein
MWSQRKAVRKGHSIRFHFLIALAVLLAASGTAFCEEENVSVSIAHIPGGFGVDAIVEAPVSQKMAWDVLMDYDHMSSIVHNLKSSKIVGRDGNTLRIRQEGEVTYGLLTFPFQSERLITFEPNVRIFAKQLSGSLKSMASETRLDPEEPDESHRKVGTRITYKAEIVPDSFFARLFGGGFVRDSVEEQFRLLIAEMKRRQAIQTTAEAAGNLRQPLAQ